MNPLASRVAKLEQDVRPITHEEALAELDAGPDPNPLPDFTGEELDAEWARLTGEWSEGR